MDKSLLIDGELHLFGDVGDPWGWGDGFTAGDVARSLAEHGEGDVVARINSGGGVASEGMAIFSLLKAHPGKVTTVVDGIAASAASLIAMAGDKREMRDGAMLMIHDPATLTLGNVDAHQKAATVLDKLADNYAGVYARASGKAAPDVRKMMKTETWLTADDALGDGFATAKIDEKAKLTASFDYTIYMRAPRSLPVRVRRPGDAVTASLAKREETPADVEHVAARMRMRARQAGLAS